MIKYKAVNKYVARSIKQLESMLTYATAVYSYDMIYLRLQECVMLVAVMEAAVIGCVTLAPSKSDTVKVGIYYLCGSYN